MLRIFLFTLFLWVFLSSCNEDITMPEETTVSETTDENVSFRSNPNLWLNFHRGGSNQYLYATVFEEDSQFDEDFPQFSGGYRLPTSCRSKMTPTAVHFNDEVFLYWKAEGSSDGTIWMTKTSCDDADQGNNWAAPTAVISDGQGNNAVSPTAIVWQGRIFLFYVSDGSSSDIFYMSSTDGENFSNLTRITNTVVGNTNTTMNFHSVVSEYKVAPVVRGNRLFLFFVHDDESIRYISTTSALPNGFNSWRTVSGTQFGSTAVGEATRGELSATCINDFQIVLTFSGKWSRKLYTKRATLANSSTGQLNFSSAQWIGGQYTRFAAGISHDGVNDVFLTYKRGSNTGQEAIDGWKTDICCGGGNSGLSWSNLPVTGSTSDGGTSLLYLGN